MRRAPHLGPHFVLETCPTCSDGPGRDCCGRCGGEGDVLVELKDDDDYWREAYARAAKE